jgi:acetylornithine aminotransferase
MGRTGRLFAYQHAGVLPDVMTLAKGLGNGVPIGACLARGAAADVLGPGSHGSTFGGNPLACRAGSAVLDVLTAEQLTERAATMGTRILDGFRQALDGVAGVVQIRGRGLMIGIELDRPCAELVSSALAAGMLINVTAGCVVQLLPPLIIDDEQADCIIDTVSRLIREFLTGTE